MGGAVEGRWGWLVDVVALICVTAIVLAKVLPAEAAAGMMGLLVGARAGRASKLQGGPGGASGVLALFGIAGRFGGSI